MQELDDRRWFQLLQRLPRPLLMWVLAVSAGAYATIPFIAQAFPQLGMDFDIATFGALAAAAGLGYGARGFEKITKNKVAADAAVQVEQYRAFAAAPEAFNEAGLRPDDPEEKTP